MRVLITGAYGFVGRYMAREMAEAGFEVLATDIIDPDEAKKALPEGAAYRECNLLSGNEVNGLLEEPLPGLVIHLAALSSGRKSISAPLETFRTNIIGFVNLLEGVRRSGGDIRVLAVGSGEEYGRKRPGEMPISEDAAIGPANPYAASKASQTIIGLQYHRTYDMDLVATRSFNHTGPGQTDTFVLPSFARKCAEIAAGAREPVLRTGNLEIVRDFLDVRDVVKAYRMLCEKGRAGKVYNVCSGEGLKLKEALDIMVEQFDIDVDKGKDPELYRPADVPVFVGDNSMLSEETGWKRNITATEMLSDLVDYWRSLYGG